ncbi:MAG: response regulator transcription factor, partial [Acidimicrobiia bacterium]
CAELMAEARRLVDEPFWGNIVDFGDALVNWRKGRWDLALPQLEALASPSSPGFFQAADSVSQLILFERGNPLVLARLGQSVDALTRAGEDLWSSLPLSLTVRIRAWYRQPNPARGVLPHAEDLRRLRFRAGWQDLLPALATMDIRVCDRVLHLIADLIPPGRHAEACYAMAWGLQLFSAGDTEGGKEQLEYATGTFSAIGDRYWEASACEALSRIVPSLPAARAWAQRSAELYTAMGAERSLTRLIRASRHRGLLTRHPVPARQRHKGAPGLTKREGQIATLASRALTAEEIAAKLTISPATVRKHLERIRLKLGLARKRELVSLLHEQSE